MSNLVATRYASALLEIGKENNVLDLFHEQLGEVVNQIKGEEKFYGLLNSPKIIRSEKKQIVKEVFGKAVEPYLLNFLYILIDKGRQGQLEDIFLSFQDLVYKEKDILPAKVISAIVLSDAQLSALKDKLQKQFDKEIILENKIDPSIMGGLIIYAGDKIIDGSVKNKLSKLKNSLKDIRLQEIGVN